MKKILFSVFTVIPLIANADVWTPPITHGLTIVSEKELGVPSQLTNERVNKQNAMKLKGFYEHENRYAQFLLNLKKTANDEIRAFRGSDASDTHLKQSANEIKLAFTFKPLPIDDNTIIGYAPIGSYIYQPKEGWNGIKVFFEPKNMGICAYEYTNLKLSNGGVLMTKEGLQYSVNKKPTIIAVDGNNTSGYIYSVTWYNDIEVSRIDCAKQRFEKEMTTKVVALANQIDSKLF